MSGAQAEAERSIWDRCYVCDSPDLAPDHDPHGPLCSDHLGARRHVISMRSDKIVCTHCGWERWITMYNPKLRDQACREHWEEAARLEMAPRQKLGELVS